MYSKCPKSERSDFGTFWNGLVVKSFRFHTLSEDGTLLSRFWTFGWTFRMKPNFRFLDVFTRLDCFIYKGGHEIFLEIKQSSLVKKMNRTEQNFVQFFIRNVPFSDVYCTVNVQKRNVRFGIPNTIFVRFVSFFWFGC